MVMRKGLSGIIGILIILLIMIAIVVPVAMIMLSQPTAQQQQIENALPYKNLAQEQYNDFQPIQIIQENITNKRVIITLPPVYFIYGNNSVYFVFTTNISPPVPLIIKYLSVFNGSQWVILNITHEKNSWYAKVVNSITNGGMIISPNESNTKYFGFPALQIKLPVQPYDGQPSFVSAVTQYGNVIYASPSTSLILIFPFRVISGNFSKNGVVSQWISSSAQGFYETFSTFISTERAKITQISNVEMFYAQVTGAGVLGITLEPNPYISKAIMTIGDQTEEIYPSAGYFYLTSGNYTAYITLYFAKPITSQTVFAGVYNYTTSIAIYASSYLYNFYLVISPNS